MRSILEKIQALNSIYTQMFVIVIAFVIMGAFSIFFATDNEHKHLKKDAENAIVFTESEITASLMEPESFLSGCSETIRGMVLRGNDNSIISEYILSTTSSLLKDRDRMYGFIDIYGVINGVYMSGRNMTVPDDYVPQERPWYIAAINAAGKIALSDPYRDVGTGFTVLTFSRYLIDDEGNPFGVISMDINMSRIFNYATTISLTENSYGILLNSNLDFIAHPEQYFSRLNLRNIDSDLALIANELDAGINVSELRVNDYLYNNSIVYFRKIKNNWFLGIVIPVQEYYRNIYYMAGFIFIIGMFLAAGLCTMLYFIAKAKQKSDMRTQQKSNFLATMSHEIRTPLNAILGMTEIQMQNTSHPNSTSEAFIKINNSGNLLLSIINDILDLSKIEAGKLELIPVKYEVASLINDIIQLNYIRYDSKPIEFKIDIDENIPSILVGDELRIKQIMNNLLSNAFKYTDSGTVSLGASAECVGRGGGAVIVTLIFQVKDTGQGMTQEQISKLFDEYTRFNLEANRTTEGAGLGMTITRNLVNLMYGKIIVKSVVGEGTSITVRLPMRTDGIGIRGILGKEMAENLKNFKHGVAIKFKKAQLNHEYMPYGYIMIVDDVETNLYVAKGLMAPYGLKIDLAASGFEALDNIKKGKIYDIVFMDHMMPKMDGIETTRRIREMGYTHPVVALTANALAGQAEMFLKNGFDGFISKPIDLRQLNVTLNRLIRDKQPIDVIDAAHREKAELDKKQIGHAHQQVDSQLAEIFSRDAEKTVSVLKNCMQNDFNDAENIQMYVINVHAMKSALANIGEPELSAVAFRLEQAGRDKKIDVITTETNNFIEDLCRVISDIKPVNEEVDVEDTQEAIELLNKKLQIIMDACAALDKKSAKKTLNELREMTWSLKTKTLLNSIAEHLLHSEFDEMSTLVEQYRK